MKQLITTAALYWQNKKFVRQTLLAWLIIYALFLMLNIAMNGLRYNTAFVQITIATFFIFVLFFCNFLFCAAYLGKRNSSFFVASIIMLAVYLAAMFFLAISDYNKLADKKAFPLSAFLLLRAFIAVLYYLVIIAISSVYWSIKNMRERKKENDQQQTALLLKNAMLEQQQLLLQRDLFQSENNFLRAQINPHFLYNCLNFLYAKTFQQQPDVAEGIMMLSQIMRYSLTDFSATGGLADVEDELEHIQHIIKINEFRFDNSLQVQFKIDGDTRGKKIAPMLLITLVENVFKHGDLQDAASPALLHCQINSAEKLLQFSTVNKTNKLSSRISSGVGTSNIQQRLKLLYNDRFTLHLVHNDDVYKAVLTIPYTD